MPNPIPNPNKAASLTRPADASKLKKHITLVCDRLHKVSPPEPEPEPEPKL